MSNRDIAKERKEKFFRDVKTALSVDDAVKSIETTKIESPLVSLLTYGCNANILSSVADVMELCNVVPDVKDVIIPIYDGVQKKRLDEADRRYSCNERC